MAALPCMLMINDFSWGLGFYHSLWVMLGWHMERERVKQHRLFRRLGPSNGASKEMGQEHLADCSSMGLAFSMCVFSHCVSVYESIPVSVWVFRCVWSTAGTCINPVTIPYLDICSCYHGWLHCRYRITSLNTKKPSSVCKRKTNAYVSLNVSLKVRLFLLGFSLDSCKV